MQYGVMGGRLGWEPDILDLVSAQIVALHMILEVILQKGKLRFPFNLQNHEEQIETRTPNIP